MKKVLFIKNAAILTFSSLFLRIIGMLFRIYISRKIGGEALGLYQLIFSVHIFGATIATAGISVGITRLVSEEKDFSWVIKKTLPVSVLAGTVAAMILFFGAYPISNIWIGDERAQTSVKIFAFSLPFMSISSCFGGYFIAKKRAGVIARAQIFEQFTRIFLTILLLKNCTTIESSCAAIVLGDVISEIVASAHIMLIYSFEKKDGKSGKKSVIKRFLKISSPVAASSYLGSFLKMTENLIVPDCLEKSGLSKEAALEKIGTLKGVVLPVIFFPSSFLNAISTLLIPELSQTNRKEKQDDIIEKVLRITLVLSVFIANLLFLFSDTVGNIFLHNSEAGVLIKILSVITPLMYMESIVDGILKGLDMQMYAFKLGFVDSVFRIAAILVLLPIFGMKGFLIVMVLSNVATSVLSLSKLPVKIKPLWAIKPIFSAAVSSWGAVIISGAMQNKIAALFTGAAIYCFLYFGIVFLSTRRLYK